MPEIRLEEVSVIYPGKRKKDEGTLALDEVSLTFESGKFNTVLGYSGCGKTTLLKALTGIIDFYGKIYFDGIDSDELAVKDRHIAFVSQKYILYPNMNIFDNIAFPLKLINAPRQEIEERVNSIAKKLGLEYCLTRKPKQLSGGQQQRVALARALIKNPEICLLDEPLSNVDAQNRQETKRLIYTCLKEIGCTVIYVTHDFYEAQSIADTMYILNEGKLHFVGTPTEAFNSDDEVVKSLIPEAFHGFN